MNLLEAYLPNQKKQNCSQRVLFHNSKEFRVRIKALLLRHKMTAAATNAAGLRQPLRQATAAAAIEKAQ